MRNLLLKFFFVLVVLALVGLPVFGQATSSGSLTGTVTDPKGAVIAGATVTLVSNDTKQEFTAQTNGEGTLIFRLYLQACTQRQFRSKALKQPRSPKSKSP